jgi:small subunit ribosomal protein S8
MLQGSGKEGRIQKIFVILMKHDLLSDVLSAIKNGDNMGKREALVPFSSLIKEVLLILQRHGYIGEFEYIDDKKGGKIKIQLLGKVNACKSIRPRFYVEKGEFEKWEKRYLPAIGMGFLMISTNNGIMLHTEAIEKKLGGSLIAYVY